MIKVTMNANENEETLMMVIYLVKLPLSIKRQEKQLGRLSKFSLSIMLKWGFHSSILSMRLQSASICFWK